jgi:hypothetical protein
MLTGRDAAYRHVRQHERHGYIRPQGAEWRDHCGQPGYETKASAEKGIEAIKTHAPSAAVEDLSDSKPS